MDLDGADKLITYYIQEPHHGEFIKAAIADNEIQFIETSSAEVTKVLYPVATPTVPFFGLVKSEPERFTSFGEFIWFSMGRQMFHICISNE